MSRRRYPYASYTGKKQNEGMMERAARRVIPAARLIKLELVRMEYGQFEMMDGCWMIQFQEFVTFRICCGSIIASIRKRIFQAKDISLTNRKENERLC